MFIQDGSEYKNYIHRPKPKKTPAELSLDTQIVDLRPYLTSRACKAMIRYGFSNGIKPITLRGMMNVKLEYFDKNAGPVTTNEIFDFLAHFTEFKDPR